LLLHYDHNKIVTCFTVSGLLKIQCPKTRHHRSLMSLQNRHISLLLSDISHITPVSASITHQSPSPHHPGLRLHNAQVSASIMHQSLPSYIPVILRQPPQGTGRYLHVPASASTAHWSPPPRCTDHHTVLADDPSSLFVCSYLITITN